MALSGPVDAAFASFEHARVCPSCGWINSAPEAFEAIDLNHAAKVLPDIFRNLEAPSVLSASAVAQYAEEARARVVRRIRDELSRAPAEAVTWWLGALANLYEVDKQFAFRGEPVLAIQQVYLHFLSRSAVPIFTDAVPLGPFWKDEVDWHVIYWQLLSWCLREARLGHEFELSEGRIMGPLTDLELWAHDVNLNISARDRPVQRGISGAEREQLIREAEIHAFGVSVVDALQQLSDVDQLSQRARLQNWGNWLTLVDLADPTPPELQDLFRRFALTRRRLSQQAAPDFLLSLDAPTTRSTASALAESAEFDWLVYAPIMLGVYGDDHLVGIISPYLLHRSLGKAQVGIARRLVVAEEEAKRSSRDVAKTVATLSRRVHGLLEAEAATCFRKAGMTAVENLERAGGRRLDCGEVDVVAMATGAGQRPVVVVCEVKDTDLTFFKDQGQHEAYAISTKARQQAERKAVWIATHWEQVGVALDPGAAREAREVCFVALVITRAASLPMPGPGPASVGLPDLAQAAGLFAQTPVDLWRPDLIRAIVPSAKEPDI
jgi:hypothetical protein